MSALQRPRSTMLAGAFALLALPLAPAAAKEKAPPPTPAHIQQLYDCRAIADAAGRLACFDREVAALQQAEVARDISFIDRESAQKTRRGLFGLAPSDLPIFGSDNDADQITQFESIAKWIRRGGDGKIRFEIEDGAQWVQIDNNELLREPKAGDKILIYPGAMGSFFAKIGEQKRIRVRRER